MLSCQEVLGMTALHTEEFPMKAGGDALYWILTIQC